MHIATRGQTNLSFLLPHSFSTLSLGFFLLVYAFLVRCSRYCTSFSLSHCSSVSLGLSTHSYRSSTLTSVPSLSLSLSLSLYPSLSLSLLGVLDPDMLPYTAFILTAAAAFAVAHLSSWLEKRNRAKLLANCVIPSHSYVIFLWIFHPLTHRSRNNEALWCSATTVLLWW